MEDEIKVLFEKRTNLSGDLSAFGDRLAASGNEISELQAKLTPKKVKLVVEKNARALLLKEGFTAEYGARELDRVLHRELKTRLMREILFGKLKHGGLARITAPDNAVVLNCENKTKN